MTLNLLPVYVADERMLAELGPEPTKRCLQVAVNVVRLAQSLTGRNGTVFGAGFERSAHGLSLQVLTRLLAGSSGLLVAAQERYEASRRRLDSIHELTTQQLTDLLPTDTDPKLPAPARRLIGAKALHQELKNWDELLELAGLVLEAATWLLWHHLEHFLPPSTAKRGATAAAGVGLQPALLSPDRLGRLRKEAPLYVNVALFKKMNECEQVRSSLSSSWLALMGSAAAFSAKKCAFLSRNTAP